MVWQIGTAVLSDEDLVRTAEWVDLTYFLKKIVRVRNKEDHSTKNVLKNLLVLKNLGIDRFVWDTALLWVIAGVILVVVSFTNGAIPDPIRKHMGLVAVLHHRWKVRFWISSERMERTGQYWKTHHTIQGSNVEERCCLLYAESKKEKEHEAARPSQYSTSINRHVRRGQALSRSSWPTLEKWYIIETHRSWYWPKEILRFYFSKSWGIPSTLVCWMISCLSWIMIKWVWINPS